MTDDLMAIAGRVGGLGSVLDDVEKLVRKYVVLSDDAAAIVTAWIAHVFAFSAFEFTPYLSVTSATKRSGKSRLLEVIEVVLGPLRSVSTASISPASLYRLIDDRSGTAVLFDEIDRIPKEKAEELWGLINSGWRLGGKAHRQSGPRMEKLTAFSTFSPKVLCGIGRPLPDTVDDRSLPIRMERRLPSEKVERLRLRAADAEAAPIREALAAWANDATIQRLAHARPSLPTFVTNDRLLDATEPLLAIADEAGGDWPDRVRGAVLGVEEVRGEIDEEETAVLALRHVFDAFVSTKAHSALFTEDVLAYMVKVDDGPWAEWWGEQVEAGKIAVPARRLRKLLDRFDKVRPTQVRIGDVTKKGYYREPVGIAASRYLSETPETGETPLARYVSDVSDVSDTPRGEASDEEPAQVLEPRVLVRLEGEEAVASWPRPPLHPDCPDCGRRWFHGHAEDCPMRTFRAENHPRCVRCARYGPDHVGDHVSNWPGSRADGPKEER